MVFQKLDTRKPDYFLNCPGKALRKDKREYYQNHYDQLDRKVLFSLVEVFLATVEK